MIPQLQHPHLILHSAIESFDRMFMPQDISLIGPAALTNLVAHYGLVDILGGGWECQCVSRAGRCKGVEDPRFRFFFDLVRIINFFHLEQNPPMVYLLENTYPREHVTPQVKKAGDLVKSFLRPCLLADSANHGSVCHRNCLY